MIPRLYFRDRYVPDGNLVRDANLIVVVIPPTSEELCLVVFGCLLDVDDEPDLMKLFILGLFESTTYDFKCLWLFL